MVKKAVNTCECADVVDLFVVCVAST